jgi:hypothetical protein
MSADGTWKMVVNSPMGKQDVSATFQTSGSELTGVLVNNSSDGVSSEILDGVVDGDALKWKTKLKQVKVTLTFNVTISGDSMEGKVKAGMLGSFSVSGQREPATVAD